MIIIIGLIGIVFAAAGCAFFLIKKNKKLSVALLVIGLLCFLFLGLLLLSVTHFGEVASDDGSTIQTTR